MEIGTKQMNRCKSQCRYAIIIIKRNLKSELPIILNILWEEIRCVLTRPVKADKYWGYAGSASHKHAANKRQLPAQSVHSEA